MEVLEDIVCVSVSAGVEPSTPTASVEDDPATSEASVIVGRDKGNTMRKEEARPRH